MPRLAVLLLVVLAGCASRVYAPQARTLRLQVRDGASGQVDTVELPL